MKKLVTLMAVLLVLVAVHTSRAAETTVGGRIYGYWSMDLTDGADYANEFGVSRAYIDVKSKLSDFTTLRVTTDLRQVDSYDGYTIILKYVFFDWKPKFANGAATVRFGLQPTHYIDNLHNLWGRRYLEKTISDISGYMTSSDLGAGVAVDFGEEGKYGYGAVNVWNGTKYTDVNELNKQKDFSVFAAINPFANNENLKRSQLIGQYYYGTQNMVFDDTTLAGDYGRQLLSIGGMLGYSNIFDLGADLNFSTLGQGAGTTDLKSSGMTFFGTLYLEALAESAPMLRTLNLFGRVDIYEPDNDLADDGKTLIIGGVECVPVKGFKASVNLRSTSYQDAAEDSETMLFVNTEVKF